MWNFPADEVIKAKNHCEKFISIVSDNDTAVPREKSEELNNLVHGKILLEDNK
jgi:hypothetical protein